MRISYHILLAFIPAMMGTLRTDWWVIPLLIFNGFLQGGFAGYYLMKFLKVAQTEKEE